MPRSDHNLHLVPPLAIEQAQLGYAIISATIPNLKSFIMSFVRGLSLFRPPCTSEALTSTLHAFQQRLVESADSMGDELAGLRQDIGVLTEAMS